MIQLIGWLGLGMFIAGYSVLLFMNRLKYYFILNAISCVLMAIHSFIIKDPPFILLNLFAGIVLTIQIFRKQENYLCHRKNCDRRIE